MPWRGSPSNAPPPEIILGLEKGIFITRFRQVLCTYSGTQRELSQLTGIPTSRISDYAHGYRNIPTHQLPLLCKALNCTPDDLMGVIDATGIGSTKVRNEAARVLNNILSQSY